jgi:hypothetical protein
MAGEMCGPVNDVFACAPDASGDQGAFGDPCQFINSCDPGLVCLSDSVFSNCQGAVGCCSTFCDVSDPTSDAMCAALDPGMSCEPWYQPGMVPLGYEDLGACSVPA